MLETPATVAVSAVTRKLASWIHAYAEVATRNAILSGSPLLSQTYDTTAKPRDRLGRITSKTENRSGVTTIVDYGYDVRNRLMHVVENGVTIASYTYDSNGNRLSATVGDERRLALGQPQVGVFNLLGKWGRAQAKGG